MSKITGKHLRAHSFPGSQGDVRNQMSIMSRNIESEENTFPTYRVHDHRELCKQNPMVFRSQRMFRVFLASSILNGTGT